MPDAHSPPPPTHLGTSKPFHKRAFTDDVKFCEEVTRKLRVMKEALEEEEIAINETVEKGASLEEVNDLLTSKETELSQLVVQEMTLLKNDNSLKEQRYVLDMAAKYYEASAPGSVVEGRSASELDLPDFVSASSTQMIFYIVGVMPRTAMPGFQKVAFRTTRGNHELKTQPIEEMLHEYDTKNGEKYEVEKDFFIVRRACGPCRGSAARGAAPADARARCACADLRHGPGRARATQ